MSEPVVVTYLRAELNACYQAIDATRRALEGVNAGVVEPEDLDACIYLAVDLLPEEMRKDVPARKDSRPEPPFKDLLG